MMSSFCIFLLLFSQLSVLKSRLIGKIVQETILNLPRSKNMVSQPILSFVTSFSPLVWPSSRIPLPFLKPEHHTKWFHQGAGSVRAANPPDRLKSSTGRASKASALEFRLSKFGLYGKIRLDGGVGFMEIDQSLWKRNLPHKNGFRCPILLW